NVVAPSVGIQDVSFAPLERDEYEILPDVEGHAERAWIFGLRIKGNSNEYGYVSPGGGLNSWIIRRQDTEALAVRDALNQASDADLVLPTIIRVDYGGFPPIYCTKQVTVDAKAIRIKNDWELAK